jgi:hypothetical protein
MSETQPVETPSHEDLRRELITELMYANNRTDAEGLLDAYVTVVAAMVVAGLAALHDDAETAERNRPGLRMAMRNVYRLAEAAPPTTLTVLEGGR